MDPAGPLFFVNKPDNRFDRDDAKLTVALRTNAGPFAFGFGFPLAQMEFMPNGGKNQPGCKGCKFRKLWNVSDLPKKSNSQTCSVCAPTPDHFYYSMRL